MNKNVIEGKWKQLNGQTKVWWGVLTNNNLKKVGGKFDTLIGRLQEKYGNTRQHVEEEYNKRQK